MTGNTNSLFSHCPTFRKSSSCDQLEFVKLYMNLQKMRQKAYWGDPPTREFHHFPCKMP